MKNILLASLYFLVSLCLSFFVFYYLHSPNVSMIMLFFVFIVTAFFGAKYGYAAIFATVPIMYFFFCEPLNSFALKDISSFVRMAIYLLLAVVSTIFIGKKKAVDDSIAQSERHFRELADNASVLVWMSGVDKLCYYFNKPWLEFTGRTMEQEVGNGWAEGVHPSDLQRCVDTYADAFDARKPFSMEYRLRHYDGSYHWILDNGAPRFDENKEFLGYIGSCTDITEMKENSLQLSTFNTQLTQKVEKELVIRMDLEQRSKMETERALVRARDSEEEMQNANEELEAGLQLLQIERDKIQQIVDELPNLIVIKDEEFRYIFVNKALCDFLKKPKEGLIGKSVFDLLPKQKAQEIWDNEKMIVDSNVMQSIEETIVDADGKTRVLLSVKKPLMTDEGEMGILVVLTDITQKQEARRTSALLEKFFDNTNEGMTITDKDGLITAVNPAFYRITGYTKEDVVGKNPRILQSGEHSQKFYEEMWHDILENGRWDGEIQNRRKNGEIYPEWLTITPIYDESGKIEHFVAVFLDLTQVRDKQLKIDEQASTIVAQSRFAAMGEMIGMIAHQWRQPITAIGMGANNMLLDIEMGEMDAEGFRKHLEAIGSQVQFLSRTIDDFRNFFKPQSAPMRVSVSVLIDKALGIIGKSLESHDITVTTDTACKELCGIENCGLNVTVYEGEIVQALLVFLGNAKDALIDKNIENPAIIISCTLAEGGQFAEVGIHDNAGGVPEALMQKIFEPYFTTKEAKNGTGLGLYIAKTIIEKYTGGSIGVKNEENGAHFWMRLPMQ